MRKDSKKNPEARCYLCGATNEAGSALTRDHIFPRALFPPPRPTLLTLPCCTKCQEEYSKDEEYFRNNLSMCENVLEHEKGKELWQRSLKRLGKSPAMRQETLSRLKRKMIISKGGILGERTIVKLDKKRMDKVLKKMIRGLHVYYGSPLKDSHFDISVYWNPKFPLEEYLGDLTIRNNVGNIIKYCGNITKDSNSSLWVISFYGAHYAVGCVVERSSA